MQPLRILQDVPAAVGFDDRLFGQPGDRAALVRSIEYSLRYLQTPAAAQAYQNYPVPGITRDRVERSLRRFRQLVLAARTAQQLQTAVQREFDWYAAIGQDQQGTVSFTGYFEPVYPASRRRTDEFVYPLYRLPANFKTDWKSPHPSRTELEGIDGLQGAQGPLRGLELVWLRDRLEAFLIQVQGSTRLQLTDGGMLSLGYAGATDYPYTSIGKELVKDGKLTPETLNLPNVINYFRQHPQELNQYIPRNQRFVFFRDTQGALPMGYLNVPVTAQRSIATDKRLMPPAALAVIHTTVPPATPSSAPAALSSAPTSRYVLNQDTGSAIIGPGRVDLFMGTGATAKAQAGQINSTGALYYLLLKQPQELPRSR